MAVTDREETLHIAKTEKLADPYFTAGDRAYLVGAQDGAFPHMGWHVEGEMGGLWAHPIKLLDGFWLQVDGAWLAGARRFTSGTFWNAHEYVLPDGLQVTRRQFVPDGEPAVVVRYAFRSATARTLALRLLARIDLQGVWLSDMDGLRDGYDHAAYAADLGAWVCRDDCNPWHVVVGARELEPRGYVSGRDLPAPEETRGRGISVALDYELAVPAGGEAHLELVVAGSDCGAVPARQSFRRVSQEAPSLWQAKAARYDALLAHSALQIPDATISAAWDWVKCNYDWLVRHVPGRGRGLGAGAADYVWWFGCDNCYALLGCLALGQHQSAIDTLDLLRALSLARNGEGGRVIHEGTTRGYVFNPGNTQETPHYITTVWQTFLWTGDLAFLRRSYPFCKRGLLEWTLGTCCPDGDLLPYGYGIIEVEDLDLQCLDTATHTVGALAALAGMAEVLGEDGVAARCRELYAAARARLEDAFWMEAEGLYGDMRATPAEMAPRLRRWMSRAERPAGRGKVRPEVVAELARLLQEAEADPKQDRKRPWLCKNWTVICPLEAGLAPREQAVRSLERVEGPEFTGHWGMYLSGRDRTSVMSINTGALAVAELAYGRVEKALEHVRRITQTLDVHMPGALSEMLPDGGCFVQAWSGYGVAWPLVTQVFGVQPDAFRRRLTLAPRFPADWPRAGLKGVRIGGNTFDFAWDGRELAVTSREPGWTVTATGVPIQVETVLPPDVGT